MRTKEEAHDYRYFPEPDLVPVIVDDEWIENIKNELPELREGKRARFEREYGIPAYNAEILTTTPAIASYYDDVIRAGGEPRAASNWVMGEVLRVLNETQIDIEEFKVKPGMLASLLALIEKGSISGSIGKTVFEEMAATGNTPEAIIEAKGLTQISDKGELEKIAREIIEAHPDEATEYRIGKTKLLGFFVGQVMKATKGKANPKEANAIIKELLS